MTLAMTASRQRHFASPAQLVVQGQKTTTLDRSFVCHAVARCAARYRGCSTRQSTEKGLVSEPVLIQPSQSPIVAQACPTALVLSLRLFVEHFSVIPPPFNRFTRLTLPPFLPLFIIFTGALIHKLP